VKDLRPYQEEAVAAITDALAAGGTGQLHAACGSGKTLMGQQAAVRLLPRGGLVAVAVPSIALVGQVIDAWRSLQPPDLALHVLAVCSDDTVTDAPVHLADLASPVTTSAETIAQWIRSAPAGLRLIVSTYPSADRLHEALERSGARLDLLILDEAHHLAGEAGLPLRKMAQPSFLPSARRLAMTATPRFGHNVPDPGKYVSMDDTDLFGPVLYSYPFSRGIAEGYLEDYRLYVVGIRESEARALLNDPGRDYTEAPGAPGLSMLVAQAALVRAAQTYGIRRALTFHHLLEHAAEFARTLAGTARRLAPGLPAPQAAHIHGEMDHGLRGRILDGLRHPPDGRWAVVTNVRCLSEGVDVPAIDAVLFAHPKTSQVDIVQAVGRALRPHPDTSGPSTIIMPIVVPEEDGEIGDLDAGDYATLWQVVRALRAHDEPLGTSLREGRTSLFKQEGIPQLPPKITVELPPGTAQEVLEQVTLMLVRQVTSPWWEAYGAALAYREEHGHLDIPLRHRTDSGFQLGQWLVQQRKFRREGWLSADRVDALEKAGIVWEPADVRWAATYQKAVAFHHEHGHLDIPATLAGNKRNALGEWIVRQRKYRRDGILAEDRIRRLDAIGMIWEHRGVAWQKKLDALTAYQREHGDTLVPQRHVQDGVKLGVWVSQMRAKYASGKLPTDRIADLEQAGMVWRVNDHPMRARALKAAAAFHREHDHLDVPHDTRYDGVPLGAWLARQRDARTAGELPPHIIDALDRLGMSWVPRPRQMPDPAAGGRVHAEKGWQRGLAAATAYAQANGNLTVPAGFKDPATGLRLDAWLSRQRAACRNGTLPADRITALEALGIRWQR